MIFFWGSSPGGIFGIFPMEYAKKILRGILGTARDYIYQDKNYVFFVNPS
jgi:hypothetical protein